MSPNVRAASPTTTPGTAPTTTTEPAADGRSTRWTEHREARRAELVVVARHAVHHVGPDVSMDEIAAAAGTSKSIVYRYFTDKTGLQVAVARLVVDDIAAALAAALDTAASPREGLRAMVGVYLAMIESSPNVYAFVTRDGSAEHFLDSITALVAAPFARETALTDSGDTGPTTSDTQASEALASAPTASDALTTAWAAGAVGFVRGAGEWWLAHRTDPGAPGRDALAAQVTTWLWAGPVASLTRSRTASP